MDPIVKLIKLYSSFSTKYELTLENILDDINNLKYKNNEKVNLQFKPTYEDKNNISQKNKIISSEVVDSSFLENKIFIPNLGLSIFKSKNAIILANIDALFAVINRPGGYLVSQDILGFYPKITSNSPDFSRNIYEPYIFCNIGDDLIGFTEYLQWRLPYAKGYGMTKKNNFQYSIPIEKIVDMNRFYVLWGIDGTGNIKTNYDFLINYLYDMHPGGIDLFTGNIKINDMYTFISEIIVAISILASNGILIINLSNNLYSESIYNNFQDNITIQLLYLLSLCFEEISILRPFSSKDMYFYGKNLKNTYLNQIINILKNILSIDKYIVNILDIILPSSFIDYISHTINDIKIYKKEEYDLNRSFVLWQIPSNVDTIDIGRNNNTL